MSYIAQNNKQPSTAGKVPNLLLELFLQTLTLKTPEEIKELLLDEQQLWYLNDLAKNGLLIAEVATDYMPEAFASNLEAKLTQVLEELQSVDCDDYYLGTECVTTFHDQDIYEEVYSDEYLQMYALSETLAKHLLV